MKQRYSQSFDLLETGDLVFYRPMRNTRTVGWVYDKILSCFYRSPYVYVGVLQKTGHGCYVVGTQDSLGVLSSVLQDRDVDIYRVTKVSNTRLEYDVDNGTVKIHTYIFDGEFVVSRMFDLLHKKPHWFNHILFGIKRLFCNRFSNDEQIIKIINCATVIEYAFNEVGYDFCPRVSPNYATLDTISRSSLIDYLFTLTNNADQYKDQSVVEGI